MPTQLLLAPVGAGKTEAALDRLAAVTQAQPFAKVWVLLATDRQIAAFRQRMLGHGAGRRVFFNVSFFNFYRLYGHLLDSAGQPRRCLEEAGRFRLLRALLADMQARGELLVFDEIAETRGFARVAAEFIYELKQNLITPGDFETAARAAKDVELARIYAGYQTALQAYDLVDREGEGWLALSALERDPNLGRDVDLLLVDGYDQFSVLQAALLARLAERASETLVTLTTVPRRERTVGRRFQRAYERLLAAHAPDALRVQPLAARGDDRPPQLRYLLDNLFRAPADKPAAGDAVHFIEAPDVENEVRAVLRRVKALLLDGVRPDDLLIALRDWGRYAGHFAANAHEYGLASALAMQYSDTLSENPAIAALLDVLELAASDFRRRGLLDVLRSPYFDVPGLSEAWVDALERVSRVLMVTGGQAAWLNALEVAAHFVIDEETGETLLDADSAEYLRRHLSDFFLRVTPPGEASVTFYVGWLEALIGPDPERDPDADAEPAQPDVVTLNVVKQARQPAPYGIVERDLAALSSLKDVLRALVSVQQLFQESGGEVKIVWAAFLADLRAALNATPAQRAPNRDGRVLVTTVTDARGLPHRHVFILGLSEGVFPMRLPEDPLYLDSERRAFAARGVELAVQAERADDEGLFYELLSLARESVTLSRPYIQHGEVWLESHLWRAVAKLFADADECIRRNRIPIGGIVLPSQTASLGEAALALAGGLNARSPAAETLELANWMLATPERSEYWERIRRGRAIEKSRMSSDAPYDRYTGRLSDPDLIARVAELLGADRLWSASQLNDFGICAFRFFAGRLLQLEEMEAPEDGMNRAQIGVINHEILERTYGNLGAHGFTVTPEHTGHALDVLRRTAAEVFRDAPERLGFQVSALWAQEQQVLLRKLETLVRDDFEGRGPLEKFTGSPRLPYRLEVAFGMTERDEVTIDVGGVEPLRVRGKIDRIDRAGNHAFVVDYKTGSAKIGAQDLIRGRNFQMMIYLLAAQQLLVREPGEPLAVEAGVFWRIGSPGADALLGALRLNDGGAGDEALAAAREHLARYVAQGRAGNFAARANAMDAGRCATHCAYHRFCRASIVSQRKPQGA